jgi:hypothetical protein
VNGRQKKGLMCQERDASPSTELMSVSMKECRVTRQRLCGARYEVPGRRTLCDQAWLIERPVTRRWVRARG